MKNNSLFVLIALTAILFIACPAYAGTESITITTPGDGSYFLDEEIRFSGTNTESDYTYLFISGPLINENGAKLNEPKKAAFTGDGDTFAKAVVAGGGIWKYALDAGDAGLEPGTYTIYAVTEPKNKADLSGGTFSTASIAIKKPQASEECTATPEMTEDPGFVSQITIEASGDGSYYMGEEVTFSGKNTGSDYAYLFLTGPNLPADGARLNDPFSAVISGSADTFASSAVNAGDTWQYRLDTNGLGLAPGTYTIYAVTGPKSKAELSAGIYDTATIIIKKPFITAEVSAPEITQGEELVITGTAEGNPHQVGVWIFGYDYWNGAETGSMATAVPEDDASYRYVLDADETAKMDAGEYIVIVQHSMYDDELDIITTPGTDGETVFVSGNAAGGQSPEQLFVVWGDSALRGSDAAEALIEAINSALIDDTYARCTFVVEEKPEEPGFFEAIGSFFGGLFG